MNRRILIDLLLKYPIVQNAWTSLAKVDFHRREIFTCARTLINLTRVPWILFFMTW